MRASIGAGRGRLIRQLLTESVVLAIAGGALGVLLAWLFLDALVANIPLSMPSNSPVTLNLQVLGATVALLVPTALLFGLVPAIRLSRVRLGRRWRAAAVSEGLHSRGAAARCSSQRKWRSPSSWGAARGR